MPVTLTAWEVGLRVLLTVIVAVALGYDRRTEGRPAGVRTTLLVALAACFAMIQANWLINTVGKQTAGSPMPSTAQQDRQVGQFFVSPPGQFLMSLDTGVAGVWMAIVWIAKKAPFSNSRTGVAAACPLFENYYLGRTPCFTLGERPPNDRRGSLLSGVVPTFRAVAI